MKNSRKLLLTSLCSLAAVGIYACGSTGQQGEPGAAGAKGDSCFVVTNADGTATIKCTDGSSFNIVNGKDANPGDAGSDGKDGQNGKSCYLTENSDGSAAVVCPYDGSSYIVRGNTDNYANYCKKGFYGKNCENKCPDCGEHSYCNDGVTGDGSCTCDKGWEGPNCDECADGYTGLQCVKITCNTVNGLLNEENGKCSDCNYGWIGENCDIKASCVNGTVKSGPTADGKCSSCNPGWSGDNCTEIASGYGSVTDGDNNIYPTVIINNQEWYAANSKYRGNDVTCYTNSDYNHFVEEYGCLYTWDDAMKVCPAGWKLPEDTDFDELLSYVDNNKSSSSTSFLSLIANSAAWKDYSNQGLDEFGFGALPAGYYDSGDYLSFGRLGYWWSASEDDSSGAYGLILGNGYADVYYNSSKTDGFSVRCLRDEG